MTTVATTHESGADTTRHRLDIGGYAFACISKYTCPELCLVGSSLSVTCSSYDSSFDSPIRVYACDATAFVSNNISITLLQQHPEARQLPDRKMKAIRQSHLRQGVWPYLLYNVLIC